MRGTMRAPRPNALRLLLAGVLALPGAAAAQEPSGPPPAAGSERKGPLDTYELLPRIGRIGAEVVFSFGRTWNPYGTGPGWQAAGELTLPLFRAPGGKVSYHLLAALSQAESDPFVITDSVALVSNLAAGASLPDALTGPPRAPFPVRREVRTDLRLFQLSPLALRYTVGTGRVRPFLGGGVDVAFVITTQTPLRDESLLFTGQAPFDAPLIGGLLAQAPELTARGVPTGQGGIEIGGHLGAGLAVRVSSGISVSGEYRFTALGEGARLHAVNGGLVFHW